MLALYLFASLASAGPLDPVAEPVAVPASPFIPATVPPAPRFLADGRVQIRGASNDVFAAGDTVLVLDSVGDNAFLAGDRIVVDAPVFGDVFSAGRILQIDSRVHGDVYAMASNVIIGPDGRVDGHLSASGALVDIGGPVDGGVLAGAGSVVIRAPVGGNVQAEVGELIIKDAGHIGGDLTYTAPSETANAQAAVTGRVNWTEGEPESWGDSEPPSLLFQVFSWAGWTLWSFLGLLIVGSVVLLFGGEAAGRVGRSLVQAPSRSLGFGVVSFVLLPILSIVACVLLIPLPLGLLGLLLFVAMLYLAKIVVAQALGDVILRRFRPQAWGSPILSMVVGLVPLVLLMSVPWVGGLVWIGVMLLGFGAMFLTVRRAVSA